MCVFNREYLKRKSFNQSYYNVPMIFLNRNTRRSLTHRRWLQYQKCFSKLATSLNVHNFHAHLFILYTKYQWAILHRSALFQTDKWLYLFHPTWVLSYCWSIGQVQFCSRFLVFLEKSSLISIQRLLKSFDTRDEWGNVFEGKEYDLSVLRTTLLIQGSEEYVGWRKDYGSFQWMKADFISLPVDINRLQNIYRKNHQYFLNIIILGV